MQIRESVQYFFLEDDFGRNIRYEVTLPDKLIDCHLKIKSDLLLAGLPWLVECFKYLSPEVLKNFNWREYEGRFFREGETLSFKLPFNVALTGERIALNLLQRASSVATFTRQFVDKAQKQRIAILDTRKTTPGLRSLEKYAVNIGGGCNHRLGPTDMWMIKDNHKSFWGGVEQAVTYFRDLKGFYTPLLVEIHDLSELQICVELGIKHVMLDNFSPDQIREAVKMKPSSMSFEVSGGMSLDKLEAYLINGVDAISVGQLTYAAPAVDLSLKMI